MKKLNSRRITVEFTEANAEKHYILVSETEFVIGLVAFFIAGLLVTKKLKNGFKNRPK